MSKQEYFKELSIKDLFTNGDEYIIPIYQRNYSWEKPQIDQLIQDIWDYSTHKKTEKENYYFIGNLIVFDRKQDNGSIIYETIDGQQRLTTLSILMNVLVKEFEIEDKFKQILSFQSRLISKETVKHLDKLEGRETLRKSNKDLNNHMLDAYEFIYKKIETFHKSELQAFVGYLLNNVIILRVSVAPETDLNHYFEIMNNRGEQLEKQEIVKARLLSTFKATENASDEEKELAKLEMLAFSRIWDTCENMEKYIQYAFLPDERKLIFTKDWNKLDITSFDEIVEIYQEKYAKEKREKEKKGVKSEADDRPIILKELLKPENAISEEKKKDDNDAPERFNSIINFSNFLLQVLRVQVNQSYKDIDDSIAPLDDKRLLIIFEQAIKDYEDNHLETKKDFAKLFIFNLLNAKFCFDHYVIKKELNKDEWKLLQLSTTEDNNAKYIGTFSKKSDNDSILMLVSMFHFSYPQRLYKNWLNAVLNYTMNSKEMNYENYFNFLEKLARDYMFKQYLTAEPENFHSIIYKDVKLNINTISYNSLDEGTKVENFIFNFLDYIIWRDNKEKYKSFEFENRNSVEHHYPQNPINKEDRLDQKILDNFGNLCLLTRKKNSKLTNLLPGGKIEHYKNETVDSIKQKIMFEHKGNFGVEQIIEHRNKMITLLEKEVKYFF